MMIRHIKSSLSIMVLFALKTPLSPLPKQDCLADMASLHALRFYTERNKGTEPEDSVA